MLVYAPILDTSLQIDCGTAFQELTHHKEMIEVVSYSTLKHNLD